MIIVQYSFALYATNISLKGLRKINSTESPITPKMASLLHPSFLLQNGFTEGSKYQRDLYKLKRKLKPLLQTSSPPKVLRYTNGDGRESVVQNKIKPSSPSNSEPPYKSFDTCSDPSSDESNQRKPGQYVGALGSRHKAGLGP